MNKLLLIISSLISLSGCLQHIHSAKNAPGHADINTPPRDLTSRQVETPQDPGELMLTINGGTFTGGVLSVAGPSRSALSAGVELTLNAHLENPSHYEDAFILYPHESWGVNIGAELLTTQGFDGYQFYLEGQYTEEMFGGALGWSLDSTRQQHGVQATFFFLNGFGRMNHYFAGATTLTFGVMGKLIMVFTQSR